MSSVSNTLNTFTLSENQQFNSSLKKLSNYKDADSLSAAKNQSLDEKNASLEAIKESKPEILNNSINPESDSKLQRISDSEDSDNVSYLYGNSSEKDIPDSDYDSKISSSITNSFDILAAEVGASSEGINKYQLIAYLQSLASEATNPLENAKEISFVRKLIAKFDELSDGSNYITSFTDVNEPQDPETVTQDQLKFPIDISV